MIVFSIQTDADEFFLSQVERFNECRIVIKPIRYCVCVYIQGRLFF